MTGATLDASGMVRRLDGRNLRAVATRAAILQACRQMMAAGNYRPTLIGVCERAGYSVRSGFAHFNDTEALHRAAIHDPATSDAILDSIIGFDNQGEITREQGDRVVVAAVFGRTA